MTAEYEKAMDAQPVAWVAADTLTSPHPVCVSSLAYMSQLDNDRGREYVPLYAAPVAASSAMSVHGEDDDDDCAWCAECGVKLETVRPGKHQHPICSQAIAAAALEEAREDGWQPIETAPEDGTRVLLWIEWSDVPVVGEFRHDRWWADTEHYSVSCGAYCYGGSVSSDKNMKPTHWRPLPAPPAIDQARRTGAWR